VLRRAEKGNEGDVLLLSACRTTTKEMEMDK
jgi:hypothetical protein